MWVTKDYLGNEVTWYSEKDVSKYQDKIKKIRNICSTVYLRGKEAKILAGIILKAIDDEQ